MTPIPEQVDVIERRKGIHPAIVAAVCAFSAAPITALLMHGLNMRQQHTIPLAALRVAEHICKHAGGAKEMRLGYDGRYVFVCHNGTELPNVRLNIVPNKLSF